MINFQEARSLIGELDNLIKIKEMNRAIRALINKIRDCNTPENRFLALLKTLVITLMSKFQLIKHINHLRYYNYSYNIYQLKNQKIILRYIPKLLESKKLTYPNAGIEKYSPPTHAKNYNLYIIKPFSGVL